MHRGGVYGARVVLLVGTGNNGGDALFAGAALARRGAQVLRRPDRLARARGRCGGAAPALGAASMRATDAADAIDDADLVVDGILGIGGKGGLREPARDAGRAGDRQRRARGGRRPAVRGRCRHRCGRRRRGLGRCHRHLRSDEAGAAAAAWLDARRAGRAGRHRPGGRRGGPVDHLPRGRRCRRAAAASRTRSTTSTRKVWSGSPPGSERYPGAAVLAVGGAARVKAGLVRYVGRRRPPTW